MLLRSVNHVVEIRQRAKCPTVPLQ
jgi:hypothetical protein